MNKLFAFGIVLATAFSVHASYLNWQVGAEVGDDLSAVTAYAAWTEANVKAFQGTDRTGAATVGTLKNLGGQNVAGPGIVELGSYAASGYSFYIELVNSSGTVVGYSTASKSYTELANAGYVVTDYVEPTTLPSSSIWHAGTYKAAPEPTSALLMMLGVAGLALKRKQRKVNEV